jgi:hypothetical protein
MRPRALALLWLISAFHGSRARGAPRAEYTHRSCGRRGLTRSWLWPAISGGNAFSRALRERPGRPSRRPVARWYIRPPGRRARPSSNRTSHMPLEETFGVA